MGQTEEKSAFSKKKKNSKCTLPHRMENLAPTYSCSWYFLSPMQHILGAPRILGTAVVDDSHAKSLLTFSDFCLRVLP